LDAEPPEHRLRDRLEQRFVSKDELAKPSLKFGSRPEILRAEWRLALLRNVEGAAAPHPALDEIGVDVAGLFEREIALRHRAVPRGAKTHPVFNRSRREQVEHTLVHFVV